MTTFYHCSNSQFTLVADKQPRLDWIETPPPDMTQIYRWQNGAWAVSEEKQVVIVHTYSKLKIVRKLKSLGIWNGIKSCLETEGAYDEWLVAQNLASNDPLLISMTNKIQSQYPEYNAQEILAECEVK